jgi:hypothetical protein
MLMTTPSTVNIQRSNCKMRPPLMNEDFQKRYRDSRRHTAVPRFKPICMRRGHPNFRPRSPVDTERSSPNRRR